jgi:AAA+ ATPase superfamily predicted ATPase
MTAKGFIGRDAELAVLDQHLAGVRERGRGRMLTLRGRRQVGKSRLLEEFIRRSGARAIFYTASKQSGQDELRLFSEAIAASPTDGAATAAAGPVGSWEAALTVAATGATADQPVVIVIDELPYLIESEPAIEGILQKQWDRQLEGEPVLVALVGSDLSMMEALNEYGRPLYGRFVEMTLHPLSPAALSVMLNLGAAESLDAYMVIGGLPRLAEIWRPGEAVWKFLGRELANPESPLIVLGERSLNAEFPADMKARDVLEAIGAGERVFGAINQRAGVSEKTLETALSLLANKHVIYKALPYSSKPRPKLSRYYVNDPYMRFWLRFLRGNVSTIERGRGDVLLAQIRDSWQSYAGRAVEPLVRRGIELMLPNERFGHAQFVGGFWNRDNSIEVDLVGGRGDSGSDPVDFVGSIKWRDRAQFSRSDLQDLAAHRTDVPGAASESLLIGVSRTGFSTDGLDTALTADDIVAAYRE